MTEGQLEHLDRVLTDHTIRIETKYTAGQIEHGGNCWEKPGMLDHALDEAADLPVYLETLKEQLQEIARLAEQQGETVTAARIRFVIHK